MARVTAAGSDAGLVVVGPAARPLLTADQAVTCFLRASSR
jgi:hypothetical protein